jgi:hypothetical protein
VESHVALEHFSHQPVHDSAARRDQLQKGRAVELLVDAPFDGVQLAANAVDAVEQLLAVPDDVRYVCERPSRLG